MDPPIEAYIPTKVYTEESQVEVRDLTQLIADAEVADAVLVYRLLQKGNVEIPADLKQSFFELICFYNCESPFDEDLIEERWFSQNVKQKERQRKTWKDHDLADQIFNEIDPKTSSTYSTIIRGMCKFNQVEKAFALYQDAIGKNIDLDVEVFNAIIGRTTFLKESAELRWELILNLLKTMRDQKVDPNLATLNACMVTISMMGGRNPKDYALKILAEFKRIGIEPSLATWFYMLQTYCKDRGPVSHVLVDIMNIIEGKEFEIKDFRDSSFFVQAMDICRNHIHDKNMAKRVNALLHTGDNYNLIGDSYLESVYYRNYMLLLVSTETLDTFLETYNLLVPNVYIPEPAVMEEILKAVEVSGAIEHIPMLWSHILLFDMIHREVLLNMLTKIMIENKPNILIPKQAELAEKYGSIAFDIWSKIEEKNDMRSKPMVWTGKLLSDILALLCRVEEYDKAILIFDKLSTQQHKILGEADISALQEFVQLCIVKKQPSKAISCLQFCADIGFPEVRSIAKNICKSMTLDENHSKKVAFLAGNDVLKQAEEEKLKAAEDKLKSDEIS